MTSLIKRSFVLWPKATQYGHLAPYNPDALIANCRLYYLSTKRDQPTDEPLLTAILNSTLVGFWKSFYGRYTGMEGSLDTEIVDVNLIDVPRPVSNREDLRRRIGEAFQSLQERSAGPFVEQALLECHSPERADKIVKGPLVIPTEFRQEDRRQLDDAVFDLLGVSDAARRTELVNELYHETALHFRNVRVGEIHKVEQRRKSANRHFSTDELSADLWDAAELEDLTPLREWLGHQPIATAGAIIPEPSPAYLSNQAKMFDNNTVYFGKERKDYMVCKSREEAELIKLLADLGIHGAVNVSPTPEACEELSQKLRERIAHARSRFEELASTRTSLEDKRTEVVDLLLRWYVLGRPTAAPVIQ